jgi:hypothetical protein
VVVEILSVTPDGLAAIVYVRVSTGFDGSDSFGYPNEIKGAMREMWALI